MAQSSQTAGWLEQHDDRAGAHVETREPRTSEPRSSRGPSPHHSGVNDTYDSRRSRACEACRRSKVRCEKSNPNIPCKRCDRAHIECISSSRSNKRHESLNFNDQLMELGGTIDHLISTMQSKTEKTRGALESDTENNDANTIVVEQRSPSHDNTSLPVHLSQQPSAVDDGQLPQQPPPPLEAASIPSSQDCNSAVKIASVPAFIEIGIAWIISTHTANAIFGRYCVELAETFPAVVIDPATSAPHVRSSKPVLFLAILAAGSDGICDVDTQKRLRHLLTKVLARCILDKFGYTIEFVQSLIVSALWHRPSEPIQGEDSMDMPQLSHAAANIAIHIGLDRQNSIRNQNSLARRHRQNSHSLKPSQMVDIEARRTWLGCYYICANASMPSQQPSLICWNQYMDECVEVLETSPSALPSDKRFCKYVRLQRATDEHSRNIFVSHFFQPGSMSRPITVKILDSFKRQLAALDDSTPNSTGNGATQLLYSSSTLYLLEVAATIDHDVDGVDSNLGETQATTFHQLYVGNSTDSSSISECLKSAHSVISVFTSLDFCDIRALPTIFLVRVIHAITILVKSSVSKDLDRGSGGKAPKGDYARIDQLDDLIEVMASWGSDWPGCKLIKILIKLRKWMQNEDNSAAMSGLSRQTGYNSAEDQDTESSTPAFTNLSTSLLYQNHAQQTSPFGLVDFTAHENTAYNGPGFWGNFSDLLSQYDKPVHLDSSNTELWGVQQSQQLAAIWEDMTSDSGFPDDNGYTRLNAH